jgi:peptidoglycan/LPS O-acetylase OafA/YrhL
MQNELPSHARNNLDFLRLLFAVAVIFAHSYPLALGLNHPSIEPLTVATHGRLDFGLLALAFFFTTSGYLIAGSWLHRKSAAEFVWRRCRRIFPGYAVAVAFSIVIVATIARAPGRGPWLSLIHEAVAMGPLMSGRTLQTVPYAGVVNGSIWSIKYELLCYAVLVGAGVAGLLRRPWVVGLLLVSFAAEPIGHHMPRLVRWITGDLTPLARFLPFFLAGSVAYLWRSAIPMRWWIFAAICITCGVVARSTWCTSRVFEAVLAFATAYAVPYVGFHRRLPLHGFGRFGDFSYGTYLYAFPIQQLLVFWRPGVGPIALFAMATPLSVLAGAVSWFAVERRFVRSRRPARSVAITDTYPNPSAPT